MTVSDSYAEEILSRVRRECPACDSLLHANRMYTEGMPIEYPEPGNPDYEQETILEIICGACGFVRSFNMRFFPRGGVYAKSVTQDE